MMMTSTNYFKPVKFKAQFKLDLFQNLDKKGEDELVILRERYLCIKINEANFCDLK